MANSFLMSYRESYPDDTIVQENLFLEQLAVEFRSGGD